MGLQVMFDNGADFSNISENGEQLKVSEVIQKAMIEVNEEGAEAAAATGTYIFIFYLLLTVFICLNIELKFQNYILLLLFYK